MIFVFKFIYLCLFISFAQCFFESERTSLRNEVRQMFIHGYDSYMKHAYPADELKPLSCNGRYRDVDTNRGDVDDALGNFSLTLIDTLDTLVILGNYSEFEKGVHLLIKDVKFDSDIVVSVFETNIRVLGGLLSAHVLAQQLKKKHLMKWYDDQLLIMAKDIGQRLLPAFNTTTGIPHPRINLKYGLNSSKISVLKETCTSCAGTMILEFAALSRLTGNPVFEMKARQAMDYLWKKRHRQSDLIGNIINIDTGDWIRRESGVGAGFDSYYEYCFKAYILLGDENYLHRFNRHYAGIMKYISHGPFLIDVHMHRPHSQAKNFMDSLLAFWPGLQVLKGDLKPAIETHEILYQITKKFNFLPEAFTTDFNVHWPHHPLRPELIESTYFLYQATKDDYYLEVGKNILNNLQNFTRVHCGYAAVSDVQTKTKEDRMDSFFLSESLKYLYLLFSKKNEIEFDLDDYVFTTEAHLLPLSLSFINDTYRRSSVFLHKNSYFPPSSDYHCPSSKDFIKNNRIYKSFDNLSYFKILRMKVNEFVSNPRKDFHKKSCRPPRIQASQFLATKPEHIDLVRQLGINVVVFDDGRIQLSHNSAIAQSQEAAEEGAFFIKEMISFSQQKEQKLRVISFLSQKKLKISLLAGPAQFGPEFILKNFIEGQAVILNSQNGCDLAEIETKIEGKIVLIQRGGCMFIEKARNVQHMGAIAMIVFDNIENTSSKNMPMFSMSGDGSTDISIYSAFLYFEEAKVLMNALRENPSLHIRLGVFYVEETQFSESSSDSVSSEKIDEKLISKSENFIDIFKSSKLKFDLFSAFTLQSTEGESSNLLMSFLKNFQSLSFNFSDKDKRKSKFSKCPNPYYKSVDFVKFQIKSFTTCSTV